MKALVLVGGFGTRLRPVTYSIPKQLIPIAGKPLLYHVLDLLPAEVDGAILATGYKAEVIAEYVRDHPPARFPVKTVAEAEPLGTGGGMRHAGNGVSDPFLLLNSDVVAQLDMRALLDFHRRRAAFGTMVLTQVEDTEPYGVAALDGEDRITRFVEKPKPADAPSHWINAGIAIWSREAIEAVPPGRPVSFEREVLPGLLSRGVFGFRSEGFWEDAGTPERLLRAQRLLFDGGRATGGAIPSDAEGSGPACIGPGSSVEGACFGPYVTVGSSVRIGRRAYLEDCVVMDGVRVGSNARIVSSVVGPGVSVAEDQRVERQVLATAGPT